MSLSPYSTTLYTLLYTIHYIVSSNKPVAYTHWTEAVPIIKDLRVSIATNYWTLS